MKKAKNQQIEEEIIVENQNDQNVTPDTVSENQAEETDIEAVDWQDRFVRLAAEFDNYRKRTLKEKMEIINLGGADVIKSLLTTADDFDRALAAMLPSVDRDGVSLIYQNFTEVLKAKGLSRIEAVGEDFNVDFHEAVAKVPASEQFPAGKVMDVIQAGYMLKDKVLRYAKVVVAE